jgi:CheY-like chemotaxis protein
VQAKAIGVRVLLVSGDIQTIDTLCHFMEEMAIHVDVCSDIDSAVGKLCHAKFEAVIVDLRYGAKALEFLKKPRQMTAHKGAVVLAILNDSDEMPSAFRAGASFALVRPLPPSILARTLRASYPFMVREMRRYYRCPVEIPIQIFSSGRPAFVANSVNISEGGAAIVSPVKLAVGERLDLKLTLPGTENALEVSGEVCWTNDTGRAGLEFVQVSDGALTQLQSWLSDRLEERLPC